MFSQAIKDNLKNINNLRMKSKSAKFSNLISEDIKPKNYDEIQQKISREKMEEIDSEDNFDEKILKKIYNTTEDEIADYIVENPEEAIVNFPIISNIKLEKGLPFFKSILYKLSVETVFPSI